MTDIAAQKEHDRRVAEAAVAKARIEWERQMQQNSPLKQQQPVIAQAPTTTIIHSGKRLFFSLSNRFFFKAIQFRNLAKDFPFCNEFSMRKKEERCQNTWPKPKIRPEIR